MDKDIRLAMFANEIGDIKDKNIKKLAEELIINADNYFFTVAASTSGKYHPQFDLGDGGLVRHTRCVVFFAECLAESSMFSDHDRDLLIVSALAHDIKKLGNDGSQHTVGNHPEVAAKYVKEIVETKGIEISEVDLNTIMGMVHSHMGKWGQKDGMPLPKTTLEIALQNADYIASRKEILDFSFRATDPNGTFAPAPVVEEQTNTVANSDAKYYVLSFGKYKGKTLEEAHALGDYLEWMVKQPDFFNKEAQDKAKEYLASLSSSSSTSEAPASSEKIDLPF